MKPYKCQKLLCIIIPIIMLITLGIKIRVDYVKSFVQKDVIAFVDNEYQQIVADTAGYKSIRKNYNIHYTDNAKESEIIVTSDISKIDTDKDYSMVSYSPLVILMNDSEKLNNLLESNTKKGFLISETKIKNKSSDVIKCKFNKVVDVVASGGNWKDLGGDNEEIKIFCPSMKTIEGKLFKEFLIRTLNEGSDKNPSKEIEEKINTFFSSPNVVQVKDISSKLQKSGNIPNNEIYVVFEEQALNVIYERNGSVRWPVSFIYPETTITKNIYYQCLNSELDELSTILIEGHFWIIGVRYLSYYYLFYQIVGQSQFSNLPNNYNTQWGIHSFD